MSCGCDHANMEFVLSNRRTRGRRLKAKSCTEFICNQAEEQHRSGAPGARPLASEPVPSFLRDDHWTVRLQAGARKPELKSL